MADFLPFTCEHCGAVHCLEHRTPEGHCCAAAPVPSPAEAEAKCPLCANVLSLGVGGDANAVVEAHIASGACKAVAKRPRCQAKPRCPTTLPLLPFKCKFCRLQLCASHRLPEDHACSAMRQTLEEEGRKATPSGDSEREERVQEFLKRQREKRKRLQSLREEHSSPTRPSPTSRAAAVRRNAKGPPNVARTERFYLEVLFPHDSGVQPKCLFFHKASTVGKVLDLAAAAASIPNRNHLVPAHEKLHVISLRTGEPLPFATSLAVLAYRKQLESTEAVLIETLDNASPPS